MSTANVKIRARVRVILELDVSDSWNPDVKLDQVYSQASESAIRDLRKGLVLDNLTTSASSKVACVRLCGEPKVEVILISSET